MAQKRTLQDKRTVSVESIRHKDKRKNIPTEGLRDSMTQDENTPKAMLYPRDPSLDPQLVWKGNDERDREDLGVPVVPIYIQEGIRPQGIIDSLPHIAHSGGFGRWAFIEIADPWDAENMIRAGLQQEQTEQGTQS